MCNNCSFPVDLSFKGQATVIEITTNTSIGSLYVLASRALAIEVDGLKLLYKGKRLDSNSQDIFLSKAPTKRPKVMVLATTSKTIRDVASRKADPTIRGLDQEIALGNKRTGIDKKNQYPLVWGPATGQGKDYKFVRFQACEAHDFGIRATDSSPHPFEAMSLLHKLATDPGVRAVMKSRQLVVNYLGEMDPIDDRLMQKQQSQQPGSCLLGYNTNHGLRIDIKLRTDDLAGFRPYPQLIQTLVHELSHNWVGEHDLLFWTNYGNMRLEYLYAHFYNSDVVDGKTTSRVAGLPNGLTLDGIYELILEELAQDMRQHGLHPNMIASALEQTCRQLQSEHPEKKLSAGSGSHSKAGSKTARELALEAAEKRKQNGDN